MKNRIKIIIIILISLSCVPQLGGQVISQGFGNVSYICSDGTLSSIGQNEGRIQSGIKKYSFQLGDGTDINRHYPVKVKGLHDVVAVNSLGSMAILKDSTVWQWTEDSLYHLRQLEFDSVKAISAGLSVNHSLFFCVLTYDGTVYIWGDKEEKDDHWWWYTDSVEKVNVPHVQKVEAGQYSAILLDDEGYVWTWGSVMVDGNRNDLPSIFYIKEPQRVDSISNIVDIAAGVKNVYVVKNDGTAWTWGNNSNQHTIGRRSIPKQLDIEDVISIHSSPLGGAYAIKSDGTLWKWDGYAETDRLYLENFTPYQVTLPFHVKMVYPTEFNIFVTDSLDNIYRWGSNDYGQLGNFTTFPLAHAEVMPRPCVAVDCDSITRVVDTLVSDTSIYPGEPFSLFASESTADLYWWYPRSNVMSGVYDQEASVVISNYTEFTAVIMDSYGCMRKERFRLRKKCKPNPTILVDTSTYAGATTELNAGYGLNYNWNPTDFLSCTDCQNPSTEIYDTITYQVSYTDTFNCPREEVFRFKIIDCDTVISYTDSLMLDTLITPGEHISLSVSDGISYIWSPSIGLDCDTCQTTQARIYENTEFSVRIIDKYRCAWTERFRLTNNCDSSTLLNIPIQLDTVTYPSDEIGLQSEYSGLIYQWTPEEHLDCPNCDFTTAIIEDSIQYTLTVVDSFNCENKSIYTIRIRDCDTIISSNKIIAMDTIIHYPIDLPLYASTSFSGYLWYPENGLDCIDCQDPIAFINSSIDYSVRLYDDMRCEYVEQFKITFDSKEIIIPNVFSPNNDGINDFFYINGLIPESVIKIIDSNGSLVYQSDSYKGDWDGTHFNGKELNEGTYWYVLEIPGMEQYSGWVYLKK